MKSLTEILTHKIASPPQVKKAAKEIRGKIRAVVYKYTVPVEFIQDLEEVLR